jgi:hypothetical protein
MASGSFHFTAIHATNEKNLNSCKTLGFALFCGVLFASDVLFGILIQESTATKRSID